MKLRVLFLLIVGNVVFLSAQKNRAVYLDVTKPLEERVESALSLMTVKEKVDLCYAQSKFSSKEVSAIVNC